MIAKIESACLIGMDAARVQVEVSLAKGLPRFSIVGLPDAAVREAKDRVVAAIRNTGFEFPSRRVTVNLAPADLRKEGACFDLAIAIGILLASEAISPKRWPRCIWLGELALDGSIRPVRGALPLARSLWPPSQWRACSSRRKSPRSVLFVRESSLFPFLESARGCSMAECRGIPEPIEDSRRLETCGADEWVDLSEIKGQAMAKRALEIAAAGGHNLLMIGSPGNRKINVGSGAAGDSALLDASGSAWMPRKSIPWRACLNGTGLLAAQPPLPQSASFRFIGGPGGGRRYSFARRNLARPSRSTFS